ncbi:hypothetical protein COL5a_006343 [Colletotrichum fioriniae]|nr:hypothetical protein COL5a_006343 [Colletotrichum fioriniae]
MLSLSFNLLALLFLAHFFIPKAQPHTIKFFTLSYYNQETGQYGAGLGDSCLLAFCIILFTGLRAATMEYVLAPLAKGWGIKKRKDLTRFSEQAWLLVYYMVFWPLGMVSFGCHSSFFCRATSNNSTVHLQDFALLVEPQRALDKLAAA